MDTYYGRLKLGEAILYQCRNKVTYLSGRASFLPFDKALRGWEGVVNYAAKAAGEWAEGTAHTFCTAESSQRV